MARNDIRPYKSPRGGHHEIKSGPLSAAQNFDEGEPLIYDGAGALQEATSPAAGVFGISAMRSTDADTAVVATGTPISVYDIDQDQPFICNNFATDGAGTPDTPTAANAIGIQAGLVRPGSGLWTVDTGVAANDVICLIEDVLDNRGQSIQDPILSTGTGVTVVVRFL